MNGQTLRLGSMTEEELKRRLCDMGHEDSYTFPDFAAAAAAVGVSHDGRVIYDHGKMVECLVGEGMTEEDALDYIGYNPVRTIGYLGPTAPIIMNQLEV
jgi:hypothetical protein